MRFQFGILAVTSTMATEIRTGKSLEDVRLADAVAEQDDFSSVLLNASHDGIFAYDLDARYTLWSPSMERIAGFTAAEVLGRCAFEVFPFLDQFGLRRLYNATFRGESSRTGIIPFKVPETGAEGFLEQQNIPMFNERREVIGGIAIVRDVTALKHNFDAMVHANKLLEDKKKELELKLSALESVTQKES